jgi:hypothetical protein
MNPDPTFEKPVWHIGIIFAVAGLLFVVLVAAVKFSVAVPAIDADRAAVRAKALAEIRATEEKSLNTAGWVDQDRNIVRLPIDLALQKAANDWKNPAAARADLVARAEKAAAPLPKTAPKPSAFE